MTRSMLTNWWGVITAILGAGLLTLGVAGALFGDGGTLGLVWAATTAAAGGLIVGGLVLAPRKPVLGSRMIVVGAATTVLGLFLIPVAALIVIGGVWTGNLQLRGKADELPLQPVRHQAADLTTRWYLWLVAAPVLFIIGLGALLVLGDGQTATGEDDTGLVAGLAYLAWILSWLGAVLATGIGIAFGVRRGFARHRARPA